MVYGNFDSQSLFQNRNDTTNENSRSQEDSHIPHHHHLHTFQTFKIEDVPCMNPSALKRWLLTLPTNVVRGKGIFYTANNQQGYQFQIASGTVECKEIPNHLKYQSCIILIGTKLEEDQIRNSFNQIFKQKHAY
ncbi:GTP-binding protein [Bacillus sp. FJAT-49736]|uniref:GTP-binding protein n=1 Tax=Bacillus sp. FJAT-49736 TaxID=2833582 RepID=UPI0024B5D1D9|nr:GTP-binding protein [Bacillus sp. FJAT-49736]